ncbi:RING finger domain-containing protein [Gadus macrocephalus]|uniref:RING finger domain-containing protein n=1 Tax=Gadus macrocephalus TaxID=80720 RepID=UPI0028CB54C3|nr:RING finger domain-containing protein [Gadus macrocephalus]XP_059891612.1 RING finger domain-containing protein [Gadus macrocephalus]XP_059891613.1 RING finger domain-containing protein [Gadus macrocephalus]
MNPATASAPQQGELATPASGTDPLEAECPVCYQEYNRYTKCPRMLECLHVFCGECLQRIQLCPCDAHGLPAIPCPLCRHLTPLLSGDTLCLPPNLRILARLPPAAYSLPSSLQAAPRLHASVTQRVVLSMETAGGIMNHHHRFIILPTVSLQVQQMHAGLGGALGAQGLRAEETGVQVRQQHKRKLVCVQVLAVAFWVMFVITCVVGVVFGPHLFHT